MVRQPDLFRTDNPEAQLRYSIGRLERLLTYWLDLDDMRADTYSRGGPSRKRVIEDLADRLAEKRAELALLCPPAV